MIDKLVICKLFTFLSFSLTFFFPINSLMFSGLVSSTLGCIYYLMNETHPQLMLLFVMIIKYKFKVIYNQLQIFNFSQYFSEKCNKVRLESEDGYSSLEYYSNDKKYIYLFKENSISNDLIIFKDENDHDITPFLEPYLGPLQDFHGVKLTPGDFNHKKITVFRDGEINLSKTFDENEPIIIV
jgi:hypothetical protein